MIGTDGQQNQSQGLRRSLGQSDPSRLVWGTSARGYGPPVEANEGASAMRSQTGPFEADAGTFGHEAVGRHVESGGLMRVARGRAAAQRTRVGAASRVGVDGWCGTSRRRASWWRRWGAGHAQWRRRSPLVTRSGLRQRPIRGSQPERSSVRNLPKRRSGTIHKTTVPTAMAAPIHSHPWLPTEITPAPWATVTTAMARKKGPVI